MNQQRSAGGNGREAADTEEPNAAAEESGDAHAEVVDVLGSEEKVEVEAPAVRLAVVRLPDRSAYAGQVDTGGVYQICYEAVYEVALWVLIALLSPLGRRPA